MISRPQLHKSASMGNVFRYSSKSPVLAGWLIKEGHLLHSRSKRWFVLNGSLLSSHFDETSDPSWTVDISFAKLTLPDALADASPAHDPTVPHIASTPQFHAPTPQTSHPKHLSTQRSNSSIPERAISRSVAPRSPVGSPRPSGSGDGRSGDGSQSPRAGGAGSRHGGGHGMHGMHGVHFGHGIGPPALFVNAAWTGGAICVELPEKTITLRATDKREFYRWAFALKRACGKNIEDFYTMGKMIGRGTYGVVKEGVDQVTGELRAVKILRKNRAQKEDEYIRRECKILKMVDHPNVIRTFDIFSTETDFFVVMEYVPGGELFDIIAERNRLTEQQAAEIAMDVLNGLSYLHSNNIIHRDIKPENILCMKKDFPLHVKLTDFGLSQIFTEDALSSYVGTPFYQAPELFMRKPYTTPVDIFATGVVLYIMLSGKFPFYGRTELQYRRRLIAGPEFNGEPWHSVSESAKELIRWMLKADPALRPTADQALEHAWFVDSQDAFHVVGAQLMSIHSKRRLEQFNDQSSMDLSAEMDAYDEMEG